MHYGALKRARLMQIGTIVLGKPRKMFQVLMQARKDLDCKHQKVVWLVCLHEVARPIRRRQRQSRKLARF
jgi:hypothetical protein